MKKILSLILAGLMTASCAAFVAADDAAATAETTDAAVEEVVIDQAQKDAILFLNDLGIYKGDGTDLVNDASSKLQRWHMALFVSRLSTGWLDDAQWEDGIANNSKFDDINEGEVAKYLGAMSYANQQGIIEGYSATKFAPYDGITYRDALTMVCRTLGYKGLAYPWGYIQQGVELGLTEGVDVAYTDNLTRGEIAVIIYNALFADLKAGGTLANSIFDVDFGWENIVIVATDEANFAESVSNAAKAKAGFVGFKILEDDGTLSPKTYYVKSSEFGFTGHEEEIELGAIYAALFEIDGDLVAMKDVEGCVYSQNFKTVYNRGITDNEGAAVLPTLPILAELAAVPYDVVADDYASNFITFMGNALKVYGYEEVKCFTVDDERVGIDYNTGNLLRLDDNDTTDATDDKWVIGWYWHPELNRYYRFYWDNDSTATANSEWAAYLTTAAKLTNVSGIMIDWMSDAEFNEWYAEAIKYWTSTEVKFNLISGSFNGKDPYATLRLFDIDDDKLGEYAIYKKYSVGYFANSSKTCNVNAGGVNHTNVAMPTYVITDMDADFLGAAGHTPVDVFVEAGHTVHDTGVNGYGWINVDTDAVPGFVNEDGTYNAGVVLYNYNKTTGEIEVVKYFDADTSDDKDSFIVEGVLQAFSTKGTSITVDGVVYNYGYDGATTGYNTLAGISEFVQKGAADQAARQKTGWYLDRLLMQYVKVVVLDGKVIDVDAVGAKTNEIIVVLDYAGITNDGYIAVYGYSTADGALKLFKINSYNGWKKGDYRYNPWNATQDQAFTFGTIYSINSYDDATDSYGVYTYSFAEFADQMVATRKNITFEGGYRIVTDLTNEDISLNKAPSIEDQKASDVYIMIDLNAVNADSGLSNFGFINVATGYELGDTSDFANQVTGKVLYENGGKFVILVDEQADLDNLLFVDKAEEILLTNNNVVPVDAELRRIEAAYGFDAADWTIRDPNYLAIRGKDFTNTVNNDVKFFIYEEGTNKGVVESAYDDAIVEDLYLLGSNLLSFYARNLLTGKYEEFLSCNVDLVDGCVYMAVGNTVIGVAIPEENVLEDVVPEEWDVNAFKAFLEALEWEFDGVWGTEFVDLDELGYVLVTDNTVDALTGAVTRGSIYHDFEFTTVDDLKLEIARDLGVIDNTWPEAVRLAVAKKVVADPTYFEVSDSDNRFAVTGDDGDDTLTITALSALSTNYVYEVAVIYNADTKAAVVYVLDYNTGSDVANPGADAGTTKKDAVPKAYGELDENDIPSWTVLSNCTPTNAPDALNGKSYNTSVVIDWVGNNLTETYVDDDNYLGASNEGAEITSLVVAFEYDIADATDTSDVAPSSKFVNDNKFFFNTKAALDAENLSYAKVRYWKWNADTEAYEWTEDYLNWSNFTASVHDAAHTTGKTLANKVTISGLDIEMGKYIVAEQNTVENYAEIDIHIVDGNGNEAWVFDYSMNVALDGNNEVVINPVTFRP